MNPMHFTEINFWLIQYAFPYFIVFSHRAVLLSCDGHTALPLFEDTAIRYFKDLFQAALKQTFPLITIYSTSTKVLENLIHLDMTPHPYNAIEYQPCLTSFLTEDMVRKYARPDIPNREHLIKETGYRIRQLSTMTERSSIFCKEGLAQFAAEGTISELPSCYILPLDIPDRIQILNSLYRACQEDSIFLRIANSITFSIPSHLCFSLRREHSIDISRYHFDGTEHNFVHIAEPIILEAFEDFYEYLIQSELIFSKEETLREIEQFT